MDVLSVMIFGAKMMQLSFAECWDLLEEPQLFSHILEQSGQILGWTMFSVMELKLIFWTARTILRTIVGRMKVLVLHALKVCR